jgi:outer membrane lipoprotein-sorting protein
MRHQHKAMLLVCVSLVLAGIAFPLRNASAQSAKEIVQKADQKRMGNTSRSTISLSVIRPTWQRDMNLKVWTKGNEYLLILITEPARDEGTAFLKREKEFWNWIPRIERNVKLPPSAMAQDWMGSDFSNDDLVKMSSIVEDYNHQLLGEESLDGRTAYKIEMIPKEEAAVVWGKVITWIDKEEFLFLKTEYYDEDGELINTMFGKDIKTMGGRAVTSRLEIQPADEADHKTVLVYRELEFDEPMADNFFSLQNMKVI